MIFKFLDAINLGYFGTKVFSDILELVLILGLLAAILSFYEKWRQEDTRHTSSVSGQTHRVLVLSNW
jgi:uncharacterized membrane protein